MIRLININFLNALAITVVIGSFLFYFYVTFSQMKETAYLSQVMTAIIAMDMLVLNYYFGSSKSSANKDKRIEDLQDTINSQTETK